MRRFPPHVLHQRFSPVGFPDAKRESRQAAIEIALRSPSGDTPRFARLQRAFQSRQRTKQGDLAVRYGRGSPAHKSATRQGARIVAKFFNRTVLGVRMSAKLLPPIIFSWNASINQHYALSRSRSNLPLDKYFLAIYNSGSIDR